MLGSWNSAAAYELYMGRWSRLVALQFVKWLEPPFGAHWLDVGCGTGALAAAIVAGSAPALVVGRDISEAFVMHARATLRHERVQFEVKDAHSPLGESRFDFVVSGLLLNFLEEPTRVLLEMARATKASGTVAAYVWDYRDGMSILTRFWRAAVSIDISARDQDDTDRNSICSSNALVHAFRTAGLKEVETRPLDVVARFTSFRDYWEPFLGGQGVLSRYIQSLAPEKLEAIRNEIEASIPHSPGGAIELPVRAWGIRGRS